MGGPVLIVSADGATRSRGPPLTDNFALVPFSFNGHLFHSVEQAFQAAKFDAGTPAFLAVTAVVPLPGETAKAHGLRCWSAARGVAPPRDDWDEIKVRVMLAATRAKYAASAEARAELLGTCPARLEGGPSTAWTFRGRASHWGTYNGLIAMLVREELRDEAAREPALADALRAELDAYEAPE